ncbi:CPBP family intramembrane metalloprotease [Gemmata sp. G18]|uniref:CPBP family intramembrane metalloprotease n=1 Tax=Gemmata palustris TaxID=2822762 RepID=A0ABS5BJV2_9BACT|nr:CPBP family glutamic-type intramembrane protease [Gemmata palustris]MBP3953988.1 CPBP family intramembrane metalloprotease [Gemmata palustris]
MNSVERPDADISATPNTSGIAFRAVPWHLNHALVGLVPLIAIILVASIGTLAQAVPLVGRLIALVFAQVWSVAYPLALARRYGWRPRFSVQPRRIVIEALIAVPIMCAVWVSLALGYVAWSALFGEPPQGTNPLESAGRTTHPMFLLLITVLAVVAAPVTEEVLFRGMVYRAFCRSTVRFIALVIQAAVFGLFHWSYGPTHVVTIGVMGLALALVYDLRKTLLTPIFCHGLHNATVFAVFFLTTWTPNPPVLGINGTPHENGMLVTHVTPDSGAGAAGIRTGDVLHSVNGWGIQTTQHVRDAIRDNKPGDRVPVKYIRNGELHGALVLLRGRQELSPE